MKLGVEYGEDAAAHDRGALEGGGGAKHEGDENTLHIYVLGGVENLSKTDNRLDARRKLWRFLGSIVGTVVWSSVYLRLAATSSRVSFDLTKVRVLLLISTSAGSPF